MLIQPILGVLSSRFLHQISPLSLFSMTTMTQQALQKQQNVERRHELS